VIGSVIVRRKKVYMKMCLILNGFRDGVVCIYRSSFLRYLFVELVEGRSLQQEGGYIRRLLAHILDAAVRIKKREDQLRRATSNFRTRVANYIEVFCCDFETFILKCNRFVISM
jgi:hypothetical protein